ncbi:Uma2 family endonuclease [soil metagenome]
MTATLQRKPKAETSPKVHRWTRKEFYALCDSGWFADKRVNLLNGRIVVMPPPGPEHDYTLDSLNAYIRSLIPTGYYLREQRALAIGKFNDPVPDFAVVPGSYHDYAKQHPTQAIFVAEICNTSHRVDLKFKPEIYARAGVPEYWVLDLVKRRLIVHRDPVTEGKKHRYAAVHTFEAAQSVAPLLAPQAAVKVESLLPTVIGS